MLAKILKIVLVILVVGGIAYAGWLLERKLRSFFAKNKVLLSRIADLEYQQYDNPERNWIIQKFQQVQQQQEQQHLTNQQLKTMRKSTTVLTFPAGLQANQVQSMISTATAPLATSITTVEGGLASTNQLLANNIVDDNFRSTTLASLQTELLNNFQQDAEALVPLVADITDLKGRVSASEGTIDANYQKLLDVSEASNNHALSTNTRFSIVNAAMDTERQEREADVENIMANFAAQGGV